MEPFDTLRREWPEVNRAGWSVIAIVVVCLSVGATSGFALVKVLDDGELRQIKADRDLWKDRATIIPKAAEDAAPKAGGTPAAAFPAGSKSDHVQATSILTRHVQRKATVAKQIATSCQGSTGLTINGNGTRNIQDVHFEGWDCAMKDSGDGPRSIKQTDFSAPSHRAPASTASDPSPQP